MNSSVRCILAAMGGKKFSISEQLLRLFFQLLNIAVFPQKGYMISLFLVKRKSSFIDELYIELGCQTHFLIEHTCNVLQPGKGFKNTG